MNPRLLGCAAGQGEAAACLAELNTIHHRGLLIRLALVLVTVGVAGAIYARGVIGPRHLAGFVVSGAGILVLGAASFLVLRAIRSLRGFVALSILDFILLSVGYTGFAYSAGGIEATYLTPYYVILVMYVGVAATVRVPYVVAAASSINFSGMVLAEYAGLLPHRHIVERQHLPLENQLAIVGVVAAVIFVMAFIASRIRDRAFEDTRNLVLATAKAQESDRLKSEFLATVSHEIRTPLTHVLGFAQLLQEQDEAMSAERRTEYLGDILTSGRHLLSLIEDILDLSTVEAGRPTMQVSEVKLRELLQDCVTVVAEQARAGGVRIELDAGQNPRTIHADERRLRQVLLNLLSNALKFTPPGGSIVVSARGWHAADGVQQPPPSLAKGYVQLSVSDTGIGIDRADLPRLFRPFERLEGARGEPGTGLGLALSKRIVEMHGGRIWGESEGKGKGSRFTLTLPAS